MSKKAVCLVIVLLSCLFFTGCWGLIETHEIAIVGGMAIDQDSEGQTVLSAEVFNPDALLRGAGDTDGGEADIVSWVLQEEATTLYHALRIINRRMPREMFLGQLSAVIFGQDLARGGVAPYLDMFMRRGTFRRSILINVCDTGSGLLQRPFMEDVPTETLVGLTYTAEKTGRATRIKLGEFLRKLAEPGIEPIAMHTVGRDTEDVQVMRAGEQAEPQEPAEMLQHPLRSEDNIPGMLPSEHPVLDPMRQGELAEPTPGMTMLLGLAVFEEDRLVGLLDGNDARGFLWADGRVIETTIELPHPQHEGGTIVLEGFRTSSSIKCSGESEEDLRMKIGVDAHLQVAEASHPLQVGAAPAVREIEQLAAGFIQGEIRSTLHTVQNHFQSDIYGFGQTLYRHNPELWWQLADGWNQKVFPELAVDIEVSTKVRASGLLLREPGE